MKKGTAGIAVTILAAVIIGSAITGCVGRRHSTQSQDVPNQTQQIPTENAPVQETLPAQIRVLPLTQEIDIKNLDQCTVAVSMKEEDVYVDSSGAMQMRMSVYGFDIYDQADIAKLRVGDTIVIRQKDVKITALMQDKWGGIQINGGMEADGYTLAANGSNPYAEQLANDAHAWQYLGTAVVPVAADFQFKDSADLDRGEMTYTAKAFFGKDSAIEYDFQPNNTSVTIQNGQVVSMQRVYTP